MDFFGIKKGFRYVVREIVKSPAFNNYFDLAPISPRTPFVFDSNKIIHLQDVMNDADCISNKNQNNPLKRMFSCCEGKLLDYLETVTGGTYASSAKLIIGKIPCRLCNERIHFYKNIRNFKIETFPIISKSSCDNSNMESYFKFARDITNRKPGDPKIQFPEPE